MNLNSKLIRSTENNVRSRRVNLRLDDNKSAKNGVRLAKNRRLFIGARPNLPNVAAKNRDVRKIVATFKSATDALSLYFPYFIIFAVPQRFAAVFSARVASETNAASTARRLGSATTFRRFRNANNDAKTGEKLRASRRDLRTVGSAAKRIRFLL